MTEVRSGPDSKRTDAVLRDSELRYRRLFEAAQDGISPGEQHLIFDGLYQVADHLTRTVDGLSVGLGSVFTILLPE